MTSRYSTLGDVVRKTVAHYPFVNAKQRALISVDIQSSYSLDANENLCRMVLINLVKNGLRAVMRANKGTLTITVKNTPERRLPACSGHRLRHRARKYYARFLARFHHQERGSRFWAAFQCIGGQGNEGRLDRA